MTQEERIQNRIDCVKAQQEMLSRICKATSIDETIKLITIEADRLKLETTQLEKYFPENETDK